MIEFAWMLYCGQFQGHALGEHFQAGLGTAVVGEVPLGIGGMDGTDVDDLPAAQRLHQRRGLLSAEERRLEVHREDAVPVRFLQAPAIGLGFCVAALLTRASRRPNVLRITSNISRIAALLDKLGHHANRRGAQLS